MCAEHAGGIVRVGAPPEAVTADQDGQAQARGVQGRAVGVCGGCRCMGGGLHEQAGQIGLARGERCDPAGVVCQFKRADAEFCQCTSQADRGVVRRSIRKRAPVWR